MGEVDAVVDLRPGCTAAEIRDVLRANGRVSITTADVIRVLRTNAHRFRHDGNEPARWWPAVDDPVPAPDSGPGVTPLLTASMQPRVLHGSTLPLYRWQVEALDAWRQRGGRGVVEAVTGTGKTLVGVAAAGDELARRGQVLVLVPTHELADQWADALARFGPDTARLGRLGGGSRDSLSDHDIVVAVVNSARDADLRPRRPGGLLIADECHRYGSDGNRVALHAGFGRRLGLSATYARADDAHLTWLDPYFGGTCYRIGYRRAIADGVTARFDVALAGVDFAPGERGDYDELTLTMSTTRAQLIAAGHAPPEPIGAFFAAVASLARRRGHSPGTSAARRYLASMQERRRLLAETPTKMQALDGLVPTIGGCERAIIFTQSIAGAEHAAGRLSGHGIAAAAIHSRLDTVDRRLVLSRFATGDLQAITAPQVLDEGVDVPAADFGVILAASRSRRQMIQRMGRVLRPKPDGRSARFVIVYVAGTVEDPANGAHEGFLEEITPVADRVHTFTPVETGDLDAYLRPGAPQPSGLLTGTGRHVVMRE